MLKKRFYILFFMFVVLIISLMIRMTYLQVFAAGSLAKSASAQRVISSSIEKPRGNILDRNGIPFTNRDKKYTIVLKPLYLEDEEKNISEICNILDLDEETVKKELGVKVQPLLIDTDEEKKNELIALKIPGVSVIYSLKRYDSNSIARHILGYLSKKDQIGQTGIEKFFEGVLKDNASSTIGFITDARSNLVKGLGYRINKDEDDKGILDVKLTLDYHIQQIVENVMAENGITGAVVVENVNTGDIAAMASKPDFDQDSIENYLQSPGNELFNRASASYNIGSVFKIIDVAALLKSPDILQENFFCTGSIKVGSNEFKCSSYLEGGHGDLDLSQAFAKSCNPYFINIAEKIGYRKLVSMAQTFGMGSITGVNEQGISESKGNLPPVNGYYSTGDIANLSIGQGVIMATPLQTADMIATVANGGIKNRVNIVDSVVDREDNKIREIRIKEGHRIISKDTADKIKSLMEGVTDFGTGTAARLELYGGAAGKTGSAETGKEDVVHAWFAGYFPRNQPRYSIAVLVENGQYGGKVAAPIFAEIAEEIMKKGY
jgi:penicillin-binding protein 2